jgi:anti-sigma B factor antagonist
VNGTTPILVMPIEVTAATIGVVEQEAVLLLGDGGSRLVVDLGTVTFMSSAGLGLLVRFGKLLHERGGSMALARPRPPVLKLLRAVGLDDVMPQFPNLDAAATWVERGGS